MRFPNYRVSAVIWSPLSRRLPDAGSAGRPSPFASFIACRPNNTISRSKPLPETLCVNLFPASFLRKSFESQRLLRLHACPPPFHHFSKKGVVGHLGNMLYPPLPDSHLILPRLISRSKSDFPLFVVTFTCVDLQIPPPPTEVGSESRGSVVTRTFSPEFPPPPPFGGIFIQGY